MGEACARVTGWIVEPTRKMRGSMEGDVISLMKDDGYVVSLGGDGRYRASGILRGMGKRVCSVWMEKLEVRLVGILLLLWMANWLSV